MLNLKSFIEGFEHVYGCEDVKPSSRRSLNESWEDAGEFDEYEKYRDDCTFNFELPSDVEIYLDEYLIPGCAYGKLPSGIIFWETPESTVYFDNDVEFIDEIRYNIKEEAETILSDEEAYDVSPEYQAVLRNTFREAYDEDGDYNYYLVTVTSAHSADPKRDDSYGYSSFDVIVKAHDIDQFYASPEYSELLGLDDNNKISVEELDEDDLEDFEDVEIIDIDEVYFSEAVEGGDYYFYSMNDPVIRAHERRVENQNLGYDYYTDEEIGRIKVYRATDELIAKWENDENSNLWPVYDIDGWSTEFTPCSSPQDAKNKVGLSLNHSIYEYVHDL